MAFGRARKIGQRHLVGRNVDQLVAVGIIEVMVMVGVGVEHAVFVMDGDAPKQTGLGELVQRIVDGAAGHMRSGLPDFAGKPVGGHMPVTTVKKKPGDQQPLTGRAQPGRTKAFGQRGVRLVHNFFHCNRHGEQKHVGSTPPCQ